MDHKQFSNVTEKQASLLYDLLLAKQRFSLQAMAQNLGIDQTQLSHLLETLKDMGLDLDISDDCVVLINKVDRLDYELIESELKKRHITKHVHCFFSVSSTNQLAKESQETGIFLSEYQSAGRGRQAKKWITPLGQSIAMSISHDFDYGLQEISGLNIAIGVAIVTTLEQYGLKDFQLKWPNDVIGNKGKAAGILIEASGNQKKCRVIIGIGINWNIRQQLLNTVEQACMNIDCIDQTRSTFTTSLIFSVEQALQDFSQHKLLHASPIWQRYDALKGQSIKVLNNECIEHAKYIGIDENGQLLVEINQKIKTLASGEVSIRKID